ncbi:MAG: hypothetical protein JXX14_04030 [Deltaproteobacteria bacterium]|nr:hypothetical protein [Deltaproteobacteria bacterium]
MNLNTLKLLEAKFMRFYPGGFAHPELEKIGKKHKMPQMIAFAKESFAKECFSNGAQIIERMIQMVSKSSMVSVFEKPRFRDYIRSLSDDQRTVLVKGLDELLHGSEETGFNMILDVLDDGKLAKWTLISVWQAYYMPQKGVFIKPTTVKNIIQTLELDGLQYDSRPDYAFYKKYRAVINKIKKEVDPSFSSSNAAFSGFLMMAMEM